MQPGDDELYFFHREPQPETCDVCLYARYHPEADQLLEHTSTRISTSLMADALAAAGHPLHMLQLHRSTFGFSGPEHPVEPRHWLWALLVYPDFRIALIPA